MGNGEELKVESCGIACGDDLNCCMKLLLGRVPLDRDIATINGLGVFLHRFIMAQIRVDLIDLSVRILSKSYLLSILFTFIFNFIIGLFIELKLKKLI